MRFILVFIFLGIIALTWIIFWNRDQPTYKGKPLSYWTDIGLLIGDPEDDAALSFFNKTAFSRLNKHIKYLPANLTTNRTRSQSLYSSIYEKSPAVIAKALPYDVRLKFNLRVRAVRSIALLGSNAVPAIPRLMEIALSGNSHDSGVARLTVLKISKVSSDLIDFNLLLQTVDTERLKLVCDMLREIQPPIRNQQAIMDRLQGFFDTSFNTNVSPWAVGAYSHLRNPTGQ